MYLSVPELFSNWMSPRGDLDFARLLGWHLHLGSLDGTDLSRHTRPEVLLNTGCILSIIIHPYN